MIYINDLNYFKTAPVVTQTNAIIFSQLNNNQISRILSHPKNLFQNLNKGRVIFEVSLKIEFNNA